MSSIKQTIRSAIHQMYQSGTIYDDADIFCNDLFKILFAETSQTVTIPTIPEPAPAPSEPTTPEPKKKLTKEEKAAEKAAKEEKKKADAEAKEAAKKAKEDAKKAKEEAKKPKETTVNMEKLNPSQTKQLKAAAEKAKAPIAKDINKKFLEHLNQLSAADFNAKKLDEHMVDFVTPLAPAPTPPAEEESVEAEWNGKTYWVDKEGRVYEEVDGVDKLVGRVGIAHFKGMEMPKF